MTGKIVAAEIQRFFVYRCSSDSVDLAVMPKIDGFYDKVAVPFPATFESVPAGRRFPTSQRLTTSIADAFFSEDPRS